MYFYVLTDSRLLSGWGLISFRVGNMPLTIPGDAAVPEWKLVAFFRPKVEDGAETEQDGNARARIIRTRRTHKRGLVQAWVGQNVTFLRYDSGWLPMHTAGVPMARGGCGCITGNGLGLRTVAASSWSHSDGHSVLHRWSVGVPRR